MKVTILKERRQSFIERLQRLNNHIRQYDAKVLNMGSVEGRYNMGDGSYLDTLTFNLIAPKAVGKKGVTYMGSALRDDDSWIYSYEDGFNRNSFKVNGDKCDFCGTRRNRTRYHFFLEDGQVKQIGSTCAHDYFGMDIEDLINSWTSFIKESEKDTERMASKGTPYYDLSTIYIATRAVTHNWDIWKTGQSSDEVKAYMRDVDIKETVDKEELDKVLDGIVKAQGDRPNAFGSELLSLFIREATGEYRYRFLDCHIGKVAYALFDAHKAKTSTSEWLGNVGDTVTIEGECKFLGNDVNNYGNTVHRYEIKSDEGDIATIKTTHCIKALNFADEPFEERTRVRITGKIGWCSTRKGQKVTLLKGKLKFKENIA